MKKTCNVLIKHRIVTQNTIVMIDGEYNSAKKDQLGIGLNDCWVCEQWAVGRRSTCIINSVYHDDDDD